MEVDERPTDQHADTGDLDKQIQELVEAIVLPEGLPARRGLRVHAVALRQDRRVRQVAADRRVTSQIGKELNA